LFAGTEVPAFGGKTRAMASLFPDDYYFNSRNVMQSKATDWLIKDSVTIERRCSD
jgi:hypothetical protein